MFNLQLLLFIIIILQSVPNNATQEEIKKAYFKKAKDLHPDVQGYDQLESKRKSAYQEQIEDDFKRITDAYNTLKDPAQRQKYDQDNFIYSSSQKESGQNSDTQKYGQYDQNRGYYYHETRNAYSYDWYKDQHKQEDNYTYGQYGFNNNYTYNKARYSQANREFYKDYERVYNPNNQSNNQSYQTQTSYDSFIVKTPAWKRWKLHWVALLGVFIVYDFFSDIYLDSNSDMMTQEEMDKKIKEMKEQKGLNLQRDAEIRRDNFILNKQSTQNDPIHMQEKRRKQFEQELADQKVKIEVSYIDTTNQNPYAANKDRVRKFKNGQDFYSGQHALLEYAKNEKLKIQKTPEAEMKLKKMEKPRKVRLQDIALLADDEYI